VEVGKVDELFCERVMEVPLTSQNGACVKELGRLYRKETILERIMKCWLRFLETDETNSLGDALGQEERGGEGRGN
jgi:hypothetical protein